MSVALKPIERVLLSLSEASAVLGVCTKTLLGHVKAGEIRPVLIGKRTRKFKLHDIEAFIEARKECPSTVRKIRRTGTLISLSKDPGFMAAQAQRAAERRKPSKPS